MTLGLEAAGKYECMLCGYDYREAEEGPGRSRMLEHLRNVHCRSMVRLERRSPRTLLFTGPRIRRGQEE